MFDQVLSREAGSSSKLNLIWSLCAIESVAVLGVETQRCGDKSAQRKDTKTLIVQKRANPVYCAKGAGNFVARFKCKPGANLSLTLYPQTALRLPTSVAPGHVCCASFVPVDDFPCSFFGSKRFVGGGNVGVVRDHACCWGLCQD
ncbi:hypothetical protein LSTR_LSTR002017, partial [Laodelphax striatellus]